MHQNRFPTVWRIASTVSTPPTALEPALPPKRPDPSIAPPGVRKTPNHPNTPLAFVIQRWRGQLGTAGSATASPHIYYAHTAAPRTQTSPCAPAAAGS